MHRSRVATATAWGALGLATFVVAFAPPIDDFWLALASARRIGEGADAFHAIDLAWMPILPGALNPQWGAQLVLGGLGSLGFALAMNAGLLVVGLLVTLVRTRAAAGATATAIAMLVVVAALAPHVIVRPQSFSIALVPVSLLLLERYRDRWWLPLVYGAVIAVWANLHGAFVIAQLVAAAFALVAAVRGWTDPARRGEAAILILTFAAAAVAPLLNPVGPALLAYAYGQGASELIREISVEWQPAWPWNPVGLLFWIVVALLMVGRLVRRGAIGATDALVLIGLGILAATGIRHIPWFLLAAAPTLARDIQAALDGRPNLRRAVGRVEGPLAGRAWLILAGALVAVLVFQVARPALPPSLARLTQDAPPAIAEHLFESLPAGSETPVLNEQVWGGYLAYRLGDRARIAIDGRLEIRSRETWAAYLALMNGQGTPAAELSSHGVRWAALRADREALIRELTDAGWEIVVTYDSSVLLHQREPEP